VENYCLYTGILFHLFLNCLLFSAEAVTQLAFRRMP